MAHCFDQRFVRIQKFHVLADHGNGDFPLRVQFGVDHTIPLGQVGAAALQTEALDHKIVQPLSMQHARDLVDGVNVFKADHRAFFDVSKQCNLAP